MWPLGRQGLRPLSGCGFRIADSGFQIAAALLFFACSSFAAQPLEPGKVATWYYHCDLDDTDQPYSLWLPKDYAAEKKWPLVISLHGLGGSYRIGGVPREIEDCVVAAPDGRGNTDYKLWGELDVVRVVEEVKKALSIDPDRVYLYGISMGGSGSWQVGVHFPDLFAALGPVCGNADHRVWEREWNWGERNPTWMSPKKAWVEATESPAFFAENLINLPSWPIHGDKDNVVPCGHSRSMADELRKAGAPVNYVEVPGAGHGVPGDKIAEMLSWLKQQRRNPWPRRVVFKTAWRRHPGAYWVRIHRFERPFAFARIEAEAADKTSVQVKADNVEEFSLHIAPPLFEADRPVRVRVDGREEFNGAVPADGWLRLRKQGARWTPSKEPEGLHKTPELEGPVEHAFMSSFVIVFGTSGDDERAKRVAADEARLLADHWNRWARGRCRLKADRDVKDEDIQRCNLILVGDPATNALVPRVMPKLPIRIEGHEIAFGERRFKGDDLGLKLVYPNPLNPKRYVALFSGTTWKGVFEIVGRFGNWFDWGILDGFHWADFEVFDDHTYSPETALAIGYFDNDWRLNPDWTVLGDEKLRHARPPRRTPQYRTPPEGVGELFLSDLEPTYTRPEKGCVGRDRSFNAFPLTLGGRTYARGLGIHPNCEIGFDLGGRFAVFEAVVGSDLEDEKTVSEARDKAESFEFMVVGDGRMLYQTGRMKWDSQPRHIYAPIPGVRHLELKMHRRSGPRWLSGPADWAIARVGEPLHNRIAVQAKPQRPERLAEAIALDGPWRLAAFHVGEGLDLEAHRSAPEAQKDAIAAAVPGSVYAALGDPHSAFRIPQSAIEQEWWYWRELDIPRGWAGRSIWLELDGAAYQADAWLNGRWVGRSTGPYVQGRFDATLGARLGEKNSLAIRVTASPADFVKGAEPFRPLPASRLVTSAELARGGYQPLGLWQPARLKAAGPCVLRDLAVETVEVAPDAARLRVRAEVASVVDERLEVTLAGAVGEDRPKAELRTFEQKGAVEGRKSATIEAEVTLPQKPRLWWPRGLGEQPLYRLAASVRLDGGAVSDEAALRFGIRTIELEASSEAARLRINGEKTLDIRGIAWLPADALLRLDAARYEALLARVHELGVNTLRVAGGGLVETETFYDLCDRQGLLVLQEAPLPEGGQGPGLEEFAFNAAAAIRRLRSHPSLVAWCVAAAADPRLTAEMVGLCAQLDPERRLLGDPAQLWTTRPLAAAQGRTDPAARRTEWLGASLLQVPGLPSPSTFPTLFGIAAEDDAAAEPAWPTADDWAAQAVRSGAPYGSSGSAREAILKAQTAQAAAVQRAAERHRLAPAAEVFWQLNEPFAGASAALVDAAGVPKPAWYALRRALGAVAIFAECEGGVPMTLAVGDALWGQARIVSDRPLPGARATVAILDRSLRRLERWSAPVAPAQSAIRNPQSAILDGPPFRWAPDRSLAGDVALLHLRLDDAAGTPLASNLYWFGIAAPRERATPALRVAWLTGRPAGPLADRAFLDATGIEVTRPEKSAVKLDGFHAVVVDAATVFADYTDGDLNEVAEAVAKGCGLLIVGLDGALFDSSLAPLLPAKRPAGEPLADACQPVATVADHPVVARVSFGLCPRLPCRAAVEVGERGSVVAELAPRHPLLIEARHGEGRVMLLTRTCGELAAWADLGRFAAALLGYLGRLPHRELRETIEAAQPAPLQALDRLEPATIEARMRQDGDAVAVDLANPSAALAFMVSLEAVGAPHQAGTIIFSDNCFPLLPGEGRTIRLALPPWAAAEGRDPEPLKLLVRGWNVAPRLLPGALAPTRGRLLLRAP